MKKLIYTLLALVVLLVFCLTALVIHHKNQIDEYKKQIILIEKTVERITIEKDSIQSSKDDVMRYLFETNSGQKIPDTFKPDYMEHVINLTKKHNIDLDLVINLIKTESSFRNNAVSYVGAKGYMQIMPRTEKMLLKEIDTIIGVYEMDNLSMGILYLRKLYDMFPKHNHKDRIRLMLLAYNRGPTRIIKNKAKYLLMAKRDEYVNKILNG